MKIAIIITAVLLAILGIGLYVGNNSNSNDSDIVKARNDGVVDFAQIESEISAGTAYLFDVRTIEEFDDGHIGGAQNLPLQDLQSGRYPDIPSDSKIYVYCRSGSRSTVAKAILDKANYGEVVNLGAYTAVVDMGGELVN